MKVAKACQECRAGKRKCHHTDSWSACCECRKRQISCSLARNRPTSSNLQPILPQTQPSSQAPALPQETQLALVSIYLDLIHHKPHTLFHPPTLLGQVETGTLADKLLFSLVGLASRFSQDPSISARAPEFVSLAIGSLKRDIDDVSLETLQACILVGNLCGAEGRYPAESLYFGIAFRMAQILYLPRPDPSDDPITKEVRLRIWWSLYMIDRWSSAGNDIPRQILDNQNLPLPMEEVQFASLIPGQEPSAAARPGLWGRMVQLAEIFCHVQDLHRQHVNRDMTDLEAETRTHQLAAALDQFVDTLPPSTRLSEDNARSHADHGLGAAFVALHLGYHHYSTLLYFHYLDLHLTQDATVILFASRCRYHAAAYSDLLSLSGQIPGCDVVYFIVAHMTVVSSAALLHTLFFGRQAELENTRGRLKENFATLVRLKRFWGAVGHLMDRLFVFQHACMWSADANTHKVDRWMVRFLLQHALPVPEKAHFGHRDHSVRGEYADDAMAILREIP